MSLKYTIASATNGQKTAGVESCLAYDAASRQGTLSPGGQPFIGDLCMTPERGSKVVPGHCCRRILCQYPLRLGEDESLHGGSVPRIAP